MSFFPFGLNTDGFHSAARAIITESAPEFFQKFLIPSYVLIGLSREFADPPLAVDRVDDVFR